MAGNSTIDYISFIYGLLVLFGGIFGYIKSRKFMYILLYLLKIDNARYYREYSCYKKLDFPIRYIALLLYLHFLKPVV